MIKERLSKLFEGYDHAVRAVIARVMSIEQEHISLKRRRVSDQADQVVIILAN